MGIRRAAGLGADWVFVLNEDTVLAPDVIQSAGGGLTAFWDGFHFGQNQRDDGQYRDPRSVRWISGCAILVRRSVIESVGGLDERFAIYCEETEWCRRAGKARWRILHVPGARLWHKGVQRNYRPKPAVTHYLTRNRLLMSWTHHARISARYAAVLQTVRTLASWSVRPKRRHMRAHRDAIWRGLVDASRHRWGPMPRVGRQ